MKIVIVGGGTAGKISKKVLTILTICSIMNYQTIVTT